MEHITYLESGLNELSRTLTPPSYPAPSPPTSSSSAPSSLAPVPPSRKGNATHKLLTFNFAAGLTPNPTFVSVDTLSINVFIDLDKTALDNILEDEEGLGYTIQTLSNAATEHLQMVRGEVQKVIKAVDAKIVKMVNDAKQKNLPFEQAMDIMTAAMAELKIANQAIPKACRDAAVIAQQKVAAAYAGLQERSSKLKWFKIMVGVKLTLFAISATLSITASLLTMGTLSVLTVCSLVKLTAEVTKIVIDCSTKASTVEAQLRGDMTSLSDSIMTTDHKGKPVERFFREALTALTPFATEFISSLGGAEQRLELFYAKLAEVESACNLNSKKINELLLKITEAENDDAVAKLTDKDDKLKKLGEMRTNLTALLEKTSAMGGYATSRVQYADKCRLQCAEWRGATQNSSTFPTSDTAAYTMYTAALASTVNTCVSIATALV